MSVALMSKTYTLGYIRFKKSLFWLWYKHDFVVVITSFHAAQDLLKCKTLQRSLNRLALRWISEEVILEHER